MLNGKFIQYLLITYLAIAITACGGGGGDKGSDIGSSGTLSSASQASSTAPQQALTRSNSPVIVSTYLDLLQFSKDTAAAIVNGEYNAGIADGTYKDSCEGGKGSFTVKVSNNGNLIDQLYDNCTQSITEEGVKTKLLYSGEESITTTSNENSPSTVNIVWKKYSISTNDAPALSFDGSFNYRGALSFNAQQSCNNCTSRIMIDTRITYGENVISAEGIDFVFDFPAILNLYAAIGFGYYSENRLHAFSEKIIAAKGSLSTGNVASNFSFDANNHRVTFSNSAAEKSYLETTSHGFFIKLDENNDGLIDADVFLTDNEYSVMSDHLLEKNESIYFTRYHDEYNTQLPLGHSSEGHYDNIDLSKGASIEINVQELFTNKSGALLTYQINNQSISADWEQLEAGRFKLIFPNSNGSEIYQLDITAVDINNNVSPIIRATVRMNDNLADTDNDGILDINDSDIDNDGIANGYDRFPKDPNESSDLDNDGIGDNSDADRDNDGVTNVEDSFPSDVNCHTAESGDEYGCYLTSARYAFNDENETIYLIQTIRTNGGLSNVRFIRFNMSTHQFLAPSQFFNFEVGYVDTYAFNPKYNSVLIVNYLGMEEKLYLMKLDDFSTTEISSTDGYDIYPNFSDQGYFAIQISHTENFNTGYWTEVFDHNGSLVSSNNEESLANPTHLLASNIQKSESVGFCKFSVSLDNIGQLVITGNQEQQNDDVCGRMYTSQNLLYAFSKDENERTNGVYDKTGNMPIEIDGYLTQWIGNTLVYLDIDKYFKTGHFDLVVNDFIGNHVQRYKIENNQFENIYVVGQKIVAFSPGEYNKPARLMIFDKELKIEFDSDAL